MVSEGVWDVGEVEVVGRVKIPTHAQRTRKSGPPAYRYQYRSIAIIGVDVEAQDGVDFYGLGAALGGAEFPGGEGGQDFGGHGGGAGFEDLEIFQVAGGVEGAFDDDAGVREIGGEIGAKTLRAGESSGVVGGEIGFGELHDCGADVGVDIDGVIVAGEFAVEIECAT